MMTWLLSSKNNGSPPRYHRKERQEDVDVFEVLTARHLPYVSVVHGVSV
jgi:hypothetical protein